MLLCTGCGGRQSAVPIGQTSFPVQTAPVTAEQLSDYRIGPLDRLRIIVFGEAELSGEVPVGLSGRVAVPLIGEVPAQGRTTSELAADIGARLNQRFLRNASVAVSVLESRSLTVTVDGEVKKPGIYQIPGRITLMQAIALGEGTTEYARFNEIVVFRNVDGEPHAARFDLTEIRAARFPDPVLQQGDLIVVGYSGASRIYRDILTSLPGLAGLFVALRQ